MERIKTLDFSKGIAIITIVFLHAMFCQPGMTQGSAGSGILIDYLYGALFLFFMISGYLYDTDRDAGRSIGRRMMQIVAVPTVFLLVLPAVLYVYYAAIGIPVAFSDYTDCLCFIFGGDNLFQPLDTVTGRPICGVFPGYYFLQVMAVAFLIFLPTVRYVMGSWVRFSVAIIILLAAEFVLIGAVGMKLPYFAQLSPIAACFMYVGAYARKHGLMDFVDKGWKERKYWAVFLGSTVIAIVLLFLLPTGHSFDYNNFGEYGAYSVFPFFVTYVFAAYSLIVIISLLVRVPLLSAAVCFCGKHTLAILLLHMFIIKMLSAPVYGVETSSWLPEMPLWFVVIAGAIAIIVSLILAEVWRIVLERRSGQDASS